jgi:hypothetical protein
MLRMDPLMENNPRSTSYILPWITYVDLGYIFHSN